MIHSEIQKLEPSAVIELFELDFSHIAPELPLENTLLRFCAMVNEKGENVTWQGNIYSAYPIQTEGFGINGKGSPPRPLLRAANISGVLSAVALAHEDLIGAKLHRHRTFARYLDAVNFYDGNPDADSSQFLPSDLFWVERKSSENNVLIEWELKWSFDLQGVNLPRRQIIQNTCTWQYKSAECSWVPVAGKYFNASDVACAVGDDSCAKKLKSCQLRFGEKAVIPFGGFPGAGLIRR